VHLIFMEEAGTSGAEHEVVRIVATVLVEADQQLILVEAALREALGAVPQEFAKGFVFHADDIWSGRRYRDSWAFTDRKLLLESVMRIPHQLGLPICMGLCWANTEASQLSKLLNITVSDEHHYWAAFFAMSEADRWLRNFGKVNEVGYIVAEQNDLKKEISLALRCLRENPITIPSGGLAATEEEKQLGYVKQDGTLRSTRIRPAIHWVEKADDPLVWLADACAFGLKRYFSDKQFGDDFCRAMLGKLPNKPDFKNGPFSGQTFKRTAGL